MSPRTVAWRARVAAIFRGRGEKLAGAERVMHWLAVLACVFYAAVALWESFGPSRSGHLSSSAANAIAGENMWNWRKYEVFMAYALQPAPIEQSYTHHPFGIVVLQAIAYVLLGHNWFAMRAGAIFCSILSAPCVYGFGRKAWGVIPAASATIFFSFVPVALAFSNFSSLEVPTIGFGLLFTWATAKLWSEWKTRHLVLAAIGALGCCNGDWAGIVFVGAVAGFGFVRAYVLPRRLYGRIDERTYAKWFAFALLASAGTVVFYLALFGKADKLGDLMGSYHQRSSGSEATIAEVLANPRRKLWLGVMLGPVAIDALYVGIPVACVRLLRKPLEIFPVAWAFAASFQYFGFKQGADIHIFWPQYYAPAAALAAGSLVATLSEARAAFVLGVERLFKGPALPHFFRASTGILLGVFIAVPLALLGRIGIVELVQGRKTGGVFDQGGKFIITGAETAQFAEWAFANVATAGSTVQVLEKFDFNFSSEYGANRPYVRVNTLVAAKPEDPQRIAVLDTRNQSVKDLQTIANQFAVQDVGPLWRVDRAQKGPSFSALQYREREPNPFEFLFISGTDLIRTIAKSDDPFATWEWRDALDLPNPAPSATPTTLDELRIAHNIAVVEKDAARVKELEAKLAGAVGTPNGLRYSGGITLQGVDVHKGPAIVVTLYWATDAAYKPTDVQYQVKCKIVAAPPLWEAPLDYFEKDMAPVALIRPATWKPGSLYTQRFIALHRVGREECQGSFTGGVKPLDPAASALIFTLD